MLRVNAELSSVPGPFPEVFAGIRLDEARGDFPSAPLTDTLRQTRFALLLCAGKYGRVP